MNKVILALLGGAIAIKNPTTYDGWAEGVTFNSNPNSWPSNLTADATGGFRPFETFWLRSRLGGNLMLGFDPEPIRDANNVPTLNHRLILVDPNNNVGNTSWVFDNQKNVIRPFNKVDYVIMMDVN